MVGVAPCRCPFHRAVGVCRRKGTRKRRQARAHAKCRLRDAHGKREQNQWQGGWATEMPERREEHRRQSEFANQSKLRADGRTTEHRRRRRRTKRATGNGHSQMHKLRQSNNRRRRAVSGRRQPPAVATSPRSPCRQDAERKPRVPTAPRQRVRMAPRRSERRGKFSNFGGYPLRVSFYLILATVFCQTGWIMACLCGLWQSLRITAA